MDVSTTGFSPSQVILAWILLVLLLSWFFIFTALAIRDHIMKKVEWTDIPTPTSPIQAIGVPHNTEHHNLVEMAASAKQQERANAE